MKNYSLPQLLLAFVVGVAAASVVVYGLVSGSGEAGQGILRSGKASKEILTKAADSAPGDLKIPDASKYKMMFSERPSDEQLVDLILPSFEKKSAFKSKKGEDVLAALFIVKTKTKKDTRACSGGDINRDCEILAIVKGIEQQLDILASELASSEDRITDLIAANDQNLSESVNYLNTVLHPYSGWLGRRLTNMNEFLRDSLWPYTGTVHRKVESVRTYLNYLLHPYSGSLADVLKPLLNAHDIDDVIHPSRINVEYRPVPVPVPSSSTSSTP